MVVFMMDYNRISLKTASKQMRDDIQLLLSALGIKSYYTTNKPHPVNIIMETMIVKNLMILILGR